MGGFAGHMMHLNDNPNLTFGQLKDILDKASQGQLRGTEKTDGQNLFVSYSLLHKEARAVRNKGEAAKGGLSPEDLAAKFADRGNLTKTFVESFDAFERAVEKIPLETRMKIFGPNANNFYNAEIMDPSSANVINYDTKSLVLHRVGHIKRDKETGDIETLDDPELVEELEEALQRTQEKQADNDYKIQVNAIRNLEKLSNDEPLDDALRRLNGFMSENQLTDSSSVGDYLVQVIDNEIRELIPDIDEKTHEMLIQRMLGQKGAPTVTQIKSQLPADAQDLKSLVGELIANTKLTLKRSLFPVEDIIHDFAVEMLRGMESAFVLNNEKEVKRLRGEVALAKKVIEDSGNDEAMQILQRQMKKLKKLKNVSTAAEGFVFDYDGNTYKFTGTFAPVNQILGLFKYGRGNVPPLKKIQEEESDIDIFDDRALSNDGEPSLPQIAIYPGRFQPMGQHHADTYKKIAEEFGVDNTYVATSNKVEFPKSPLNFDEKREIMIRHGIPADKIIQVKNPYNATELLDVIGPGNVEAVYFVGAKDMDEDPRFKKTSGVTEDGYDWKIEVAPHVDREIEGFGEMSGTSLRSALQRADEETFEKIMGWFDPGVYNMLLDKLNTIEEISAQGVSGGGAIEGYSGRKKKKLKKGMIMREEIMYELKLRELIRHRINKTLEENKNQGVIMINERQKDMLDKYQREHALRKIIRKLILQEKTEPVPHSNTGINQLTDLLKKIVPILSVGYKSLTTSEEQRTSYRSHVLNAVINALAPQQAEDKVDDQIGADAGELTEVDIGIDDDEEIGDERFIDIDPPAEEEDKKAFETLPGQDLTGRNVALKDFDRVERIILDSYDVLDNEKDQDLFYDYLLTNLKLYFDKFEGELSVDDAEPTTDEYEAEKAQEEELPGESAEELEGGALEESLSSKEQLERAYGAYEASKNLPNRRGSPEDENTKVFWAKEIKKLGGTVPGELEEVYSEKQRRMACARKDEKPEFAEMCTGPMKKKKSA